MGDWAAKVLGDVPVAYFNTRQADTPSGNLLPEQWMPAADVIAAIAKLAEGDGLVERLLAYSSMDDHLSHRSDTERLAAAHITALTAQVAELEAALSKIDVGEGWAAIIARTALKEAGRK